MTVELRISTACARPARTPRAGVAAAMLLLAGCGGSGNPLDNPSSVKNPNSGQQGQKLSFAYFQTCINPILKKVLPIDIGGVISNNQCAGSGCHNGNTGTGGSFRVLGTAADEPLPPSTGSMSEDDKTRIRASAEIYRNYYSAQGATVIGAPTSSLLLNKPLVLNVLHGGGLIFHNDGTDTNVKQMAYWINHPAPQGEDEFSVTTYSMFEGGEPDATKCKSE